MCIKFEKVRLSEHTQNNISNEKTYLIKLM